MSKKVMTLLFVLVISVSLGLGACAPKATEAPAATEAPVKEPVKAALLLEGPLADTGWNTSSWTAMQEMQKEYGWDVSYVDNTETEDMEDMLRGYGQKGYDIVFGPGWLFSEPMIKISDEFPDTMFVNIDERNDHGPNFVSNGWPTGELTYFAGLVAGGMTKSGKLAYIVGTQSPSDDYDAEVFGNAAKTLKPDASLVVSYVGNWQDPAKAKELAKANIESGVDVILSVAGSGDFGVFEAVEEAKAAGKDVKYIGWTGDTCEFLPENTIVSGVQLPGYLLKLAAVEFEKGTLKPGYTIYGLKEDAHHLAWCGSNVPQDLKDKVEQAMQDYLDGKLEVPVRTDI